MAKMPALQTACPSDAELRALAARGAVAELGPVGAHVEGCEACRALLSRRAVTSPDVHAATVPAPLLPVRDDDSQTLKLATVERERYLIRRELARGGMGRILEAWDRRHRRKVAIKVLLQPRHEAHLRFVREATITARLQHPGIVPLYEAGEWTAGEPFFVMKLVEGRPFNEVIADAQTLAQKLALLPNMIATTEAIAYAHDNGIIHRDIKPSNVLLGDFGETVVIDWGIAKDLNHLPDSADGDGEAGLDAPSPEFKTREGSSMGTVGYMAPEQARSALVDARADVYSLGAVLYHLFAGIPPHPSNSVVESLAKLMEGPPEPLATLVPDLAPDIVTIVEKAMAREPADRYQDARAMAEDLTRFAAGKLVAAHSYSFQTLLRRWAVRYRAVLMTAAVLLAALLATVSVSVRRVVRERDNAAAARAEAEQARSIAVAQRDAAEKLVEFVVGDLKHKLENVGRLDLIAGIGDEVDRYYQSASSFTYDAPTLVRRAQAIQLIGVVRDQQLDEKGAGVLFEHAIALCERALELSPHDLPAEIALINIQVGLAGSLRDLGHLDEAEQHARHAVDVGHDAVTSHAGDPRADGILARADLRLALVARAAHHDADTEPLYNEACTLLERAIVLAPNDLSMQRQVGWAYFERGDAALERGDLETGTKSFARSVEVRDALYRRDPSPDRASDLSWARLQGAEVRFRKGEFDAAASDGAAAVSSLEGSIDLNSAMGKRNLADALTTLAYDEVGVGLCADAAARAERASGIFDGSLGEVANTETIALLLQTLGTLGDADLCAGHSHDARAPLERASALFAKSPDQKLDTFAEAMDTVGPSLALAQLGDHAPDQALVTARAAVTRAEARLQSQPGAYPALEAVGLAQMALGDVLAARHDPAAAASYRAAHDAFVQGVKGSRAALTDPVTTAEAAVKLARLAPTEEARALATEAVTALEPLERAHRLVPRGVSALREARDPRLFARPPAP
jgi:tetratricopeptide (TPR) repeat protein